VTFTEMPFLYFFPPVYLLWWLLRGDPRRQVWLLLAASLLFYGFNHWELMPILLGCVGANWAAGLWIDRSRRPRLVLAAGVTLNLVLLAYWKYTPLLWDTTNRLRAAAGLPPGPPAPSGWDIPFGISFYAFTGIAYMVDVSRKATPAEAHPARYALSVSFFPHLVAGPILRPNEFLTRLHPETMPRRPLDPLEACLLVGRGLFKKMVLADRVAAAADPFFAHVADPTTAGVWALPYAWLYALQIYFDFSGYTDIARGLGLLFGYRWPENFDRPYLAASVAEFWHRWHMTLSRFLRDYLFIPLGGSRGGPWKTARNLMLTMTLGGLWHGASWSFLVWGGLHGGLLVLHRFWSATALRDRLAALGGPAGRAWRLACVALTFHCVCLAWCFFRLTAFADACACVGKWFAFDADRLWSGGVRDRSLWMALAAYGVLALLAARGPAWLASVQRRSALRPVLHGFLWGYGAMLVLLAALLAPGGTKAPFIYFQF
jgi:alginate O-acetyltransferase complex protein AlgI